MDPTKPILGKSRISIDIYNTSYYTNKEKPTKYTNNKVSEHPTNTSNLHYKQNSNYHKQIQNYSKKSSH